MGILNNTVSICQFQVRGELPPQDLVVWAGERLEQNAFRPIDSSAEELSIGWVRIDDSQSSAFSATQGHGRDNYLTFSLRIDQRRIPGALLKAHLDKAAGEFLAAHPGLQRVPKGQREELRDAVRGALLARTLPAPATFDVVWNTRTGLVTFASLSPKVIEIFEDLFKQTFSGLRLVTVHPMARAAMVVAPPLLPALEEANQASSGAVLDQIEGNAWLGEEFLLYLLYQTLEGSSTYRVCRPGPALEGETFVAYLNDRLILVGGDEAGIQKITVAGPQERFSEVRTALGNHKAVREAILYLEKGEDLWKLTLKGGVFHFASLKAPKVQLERDQTTDPAAEKAAVFYERMALLEEGLQLFDSLLATFLDLRLGQGWPKTAAQLQQWLRPAAETVS